MVVLKISVKINVTWIWYGEFTTYFMVKNSTQITFRFTGLEDLTLRYLVDPFFSNKILVIIIIDMNTDLAIF